MIQMAVEQAKTLGDFLNIYVAHTNEFASSVTPYVEVRGGMATFGELRRFEPLIEPAQNDGFMIGLMLTILERALGDGLEPERVLLVVSDLLVLHDRFDPYQVLRGNKMGPGCSFQPNGCRFPYLVKAYKQKARDGLSRRLRIFS